jgi:hypothetical protein
LRSARPSPSAMAIRVSRASAVTGKRAAELGLGAGGERLQRGGVQAAQGEDLRAGEKRRVQLERGVLGRGADEQDDPSSIRGRKASCWARLKRWISSTKRRVARPFAWRRRAASKIFLRSATPVKMALIWTKAASVSAASRRATVVLPTPGGPQRMIEPRSSRRAPGRGGPSGRGGGPGRSPPKAEPGGGGRRAGGTLERGPGLRGAGAGREGIEKVGHGWVIAAPSAGAFVRVGSAGQVGSCQIGQPV